MKRIDYKTLARWGGALAITVLAVGFRLWLQPILGFEFHYGALLAAVAIAAWAFGLWQGIAVSVLGTLGLDLAVRGTMFPRNSDEVAGLLLFVGEGLIVVVVVEIQRRIQARLRQSEARATELLAAYEQELAERKRVSAAERRHLLWLEVILSSMGDGLLVTDDLGAVTYINAAAEKITGVPAAKAHGQSVDDLLPLVDEATGEAVPSAFTAEVDYLPPRPLPEKTALLTPEGAKIPVIVSSAVMREESGVSTGVVFLIHDITPLREIEARRFDSEQRFTDLADSVPALIWISGVDGKWEYFNDSWRQLTGISPDQMYGFGWMSGIHP